VEQQDRAAVRLLGGDVHVSHFQRIALRLETENFHRKRVTDFLETTSKLPGNFLVRMQTRNGEKHDEKTGHHGQAGRGFHRKIFESSVMAG
jgi:hypothetical protein